MSDTDTDERVRTEWDRDVAVVGGGPAGCSVGVFIARAGLDTVIFDRGRSSIRRCAYLENYLGFPDGIDVETLYALMHDHAETAGCAIVLDLVESVTPTEEGAGFVLEPQEGEPITARRVVAATRYDGEYLRGLDDDGAMFETFEHDGEEGETFDGSYADRDGTTPVAGLYVASPSEEADMQAIVAAGRGARVARRVVADARIDDGWWEAPASGVDWLRREAERDGRWTDRERWVEWFDDRYAGTASVGPDSERFRRVRETLVDELRSTYVSPDEIETRTEAGHESLATHLDAGAIVDAVGEATLLDEMDDDAIRAHVGTDRTAGERDRGE